MHLIFLNHTTIYIIDNLQSDFLKSEMWLFLWASCIIKNNERNYLQKHKSKRRLSKWPDILIFSTVTLKWEISLGITLLWRLTVTSETVKNVKGFLTSPSPKDQCLKKNPEAHNRLLWPCAFCGLGKAIRKQRTWGIQQIFHKTI